MSILPEAPHLDHVMASLPPGAYHQLLESEPILSRLGRFRLKKADSSLVGVYASAGLSGRNTLVEFFSLDRPLLAGITGGLVLSFEVPGSSEQAAALLDQNGITDVDQELVRRSVPDSSEQQPWYHLLRPSMGEGSPFVLFISEVTPQYFSHLEAKQGAQGEFPRQAYLDAVLGPASPDQLLGDIARVILALHRDRVSRLAEVLVCLGYSSRNAGGAVTLSAPDTELMLIPAEEGRDEGIREIEFRLDRPSESRLDLSFCGVASLQAAPGSNTAILSFLPQATV